MGVGMGFCIMKNIIYLTACLFIVSCLKKQDLDSADSYTPVNADEVEGKMGSSLGALSYYDVKLNELNIITADSSYEDGRPTNRYKQNLKVTKISDAPDALTFDFIFSKEDFVRPENSLTDQPYKMVLTKSKSLQDQFNALKTVDDTPKPFFMYRAYLYYALQGCREAGVSCYNFKTENRTYMYDFDVASSQLCATSQNCLLNGKRIEFDLLDSTIPTDDGKPYRTHYTFDVVPQMPFFSKVINYCARGLVKIGTRQVLAEDCLKLSGFSTGQ